MPTILTMTPAELAKWRERNLCSQGILAMVLDVDVMTISRWERDVQKIPPFLRYALAYIEDNRGILREAKKIRLSERRAGEDRRASERRLAQRRAIAKAVKSNKRISERRNEEKRRQKRRQS